MRLLHASLKNFRNLQDISISFGAHFTVLEGQNGQGKTNTLEGLYFIAALRALRTSKRESLIGPFGPSAYLCACIEHQGTMLDHNITVILEAKSRSLQKDGKKITPSNLLGTFVAVSFEPDDLSFAKGSPEARRRFLDRALLNGRPSYLQTALRYQRAVQDRNRMLQSNAPDTMMDPFEEIIAKEGGTITYLRYTFVKDLAPRIEGEFYNIAKPAPKLVVQYRSKLLDQSKNISVNEKTCQEQLLLALKERRPIDRNRKITSIGPHLDDLDCFLDDVLAKERASQGQHRALVLAIKLAEIESLRETLGEAPVLLLDDMSSELDRARTEQLFHRVRALEGQIVMTSTFVDKDMFSRLFPGDELRHYQVVDGSMSLVT